MPVLDTAFLIRLQAGDAAARDLLEQLAGQPLVVPPWVVVEFLTGHTGAPERVRQELDRAFMLVETDAAWTIAAARFRRELHRKGTKIRLPDFWIATFARLLDTPVVTQDVKHFAAMGIETISW